MSVRKYEYQDRIVLQFSDGKRASYSRKRYGLLIEDIVDQSIKLDKKIFNPIRENKESIEIMYWDSNKNRVFAFIVDKDIDESYRDRYWATNSNGYVHTTTKTKGNRPLYLHWFVMDFTKRDREEKRVVVDHVNHEILDNRRENLRIVTTRENNTNQRNQMNIGVGRDGNGWRARWSVNGVDFSKSFFGGNAFDKAKKHRLKMMKETGYLVTFNDYSERK